MQEAEAETSLTPCDRLQNVLDLVREFIGDRFDDMDAAVAKVVGPPLRSLGPGAAYPLGICAGVVVAALTALALGSRGTESHTAAQFSLAALGIATVAAWLGAEAARLALPAGYEPAKTTDVEASEAPKDGAPKEPRLKALRAGAEFAAWMAFLYLCDRTDLVARGPKHTEASSFWKLWALICVAAACTVRACRAPRTLAREQTEEWKGWMQLMFLLYHYFAQAPLYNAIRVYIAAYVWMTGYGNFLYYQKTGNFSAVRVCQTLFRLNFFVVFVCVGLRNEYMLYYIAPMHTLFTLFVWLALRVGKGLNQDNRAVAAKVLATLACVVLLYDVEPVFRAAFGWPPLRQLVAFHDPLHPEFTDELHEWHFRSGLDRYIWVFGMACAAGMPALERAFARLDAVQPRVFWSLVAAALAVLGGAFWLYADEVFLLDKYAYNAKHPYTSWIPIAGYILLRNLTPWLRSHYFHLFTFLGQVTLETYILQFHIWMKTTGLNGSPKFLLVLFPGYFWLNFAVVSAVYFLVSVRVFRLTVALRDALVPQEADQLPKAFGILGVVFVALASVGLATRAVVPLPE